MVTTCIYTVFFQVLSYGHRVLLASRILRLVERERPRTRVLHLQLSDS